MVNGNVNRVWRRSWRSRRPGILRDELVELVGREEPEPARVDLDVAGSEVGIDADRLRIGARLDLLPTAVASS